MLAPESSVRTPLIAPVDDWAAAKEAPHTIPKDKKVSLRK
jgi:hypothetical protein